MTRHSDTRDLLLAQLDQALAEILHRVPPIEQGTFGWLTDDPHRSPDTSVTAHTTVLIRDQSVRIVGIATAKGSSFNISDLPEGKTGAFTDRDGFLGLCKELDLPIPGEEPLNVQAWRELDSALSLILDRQPATGDALNYAWHHIPALLMPFGRGNVLIEGMAHIPDFGTVTAGRTILDGNPVFSLCGYIVVRFAARAFANRAQLEEVAHRLGLTIPSPF
jgi:hypothetical protein